MGTIWENVLIAIFLVANWYLAQVIMYYCAKQNILWTLIQEGHSIAIMHNGVFNRMIMRYAGHAFTNKMKEGKDSLEIYDIEPTPTKSVISGTLSNLIFPAKGVAWIGLPPWSTIYHERIKWTDDRFVERDEDVYQFLVQKYVYGITLPKLELEGGIPYDIRILVTLHLTNPAKAYFRVKRWVDTSTERISGWARTEMSALSIDDFVTPTDGDTLPQIHSSTKLNQAIERIVAKINNELSPEFGVGSSSCVVNKIDPSDEKMRGVIVAKEIAKNEGEAKFIKAQFEAQALSVVNEAAEKMGDKGMQLQAYNAIQNAGAHVTLVGSNVNSLISVGTTQASAPRPALALEPVAAPSTT